MMSRVRWSVVAAIGVALAITTGAWRATTAETPAARRASDALRVVLVTHAGAEPADARIRVLQQRLATGGPQVEVLERLGWSFVAKAQASADPGYFTLAERCAVAMDELEPDAAAARLLRGHALLSLHRFREAEPIARRLVTERGRPFDWALLGDALMEAGEEHMNRA